ncbi:MAG: hypothetical protein ACEPO8_05610 [Rhodothermaceae bacterium]
MKNGFYNTFVICVIAFSCLSLFGDKLISFQTDDPNFEAPENKNKVILTLCEDYDAEKIDLSYKDKFADLMEKTVILDSLLIGTYSKAGEFYVKVSVCSEETGYINAELKCDKSVFDKIEKMQNTTMIIAANLSGFTKSKVPLFLDNFDGSENQFKLIDEIKLKGKCLEVVEVSIFDS